MSEKPTMHTPKDPTTTQAWARLQEHKQEVFNNKHLLKAWFSQDPNRTARFSFKVNDLLFDLSKNLMTPTTVELLCDLAREMGIESRRDAMFAGEHLNTTENRAVLHTALRRPADQAGKLLVDGQDVVADVREVLQRMYRFAEDVRAGRWCGVTGKRIKTVVSIGIGGSDLGPFMMYEALKSYADVGIQCRFVSNIDPTDLAEKTADLDPQTTLFIVVSKTFTTLETLTNARCAKTWLLDELRKAGVIAQDDAPANAVSAASAATATAPATFPTAADGIEHHFVAVSTNLELVREFGINPDNAFGFWDWVGGRYSVDSAVGLALIIAFGPERFEELLRGFYAMDQHFLNTPLQQNVPVLMGLLNIWYVNFFGMGSHAVLPYDQHLHRFPAYLQQLTMESNGKSVRWDGTSVTTQTGELFWGEPGTNGQHAFYQLIHQGTRKIPCDFIAFANPVHPTQDTLQDVHELLLGNFLAQTKALAFGKTPDEVRAEGTAEWMVAARVFEGDRPTTSIFGEKLTPFALGELVSLYEHITFVEGSIWDINSYDQWGVELGKQLAHEITPAFHDDTALKQQDQSTQSLIMFYREKRRH